MTKAQNGIITETIFAAEMLYKLQSDQNTDIFDDEITEMLLICICSLRALQKSIQRTEILNTIKQN